ncbi:hypothetical protein Tco_1581185, partial [Tanacetum coccineum]
SESDNLFHNHIQGEDEQAKDVQMADHLRLMEELLRIPIVGADETWLENEPPNSITTWDDLVSNGGSSIQNDAITALTKQVEALISSMQETYDQNQEAAVQLMQNQMGQMADFQERPLEKEQEPETITEVVEIASSKSTPLVPPPETPPLSAPKPKDDLEPNPHQPLIPYPSRLQKEKFQALENLTGRTDYFLL